MSLGLDALNKLQRMQSEGAAAPTTAVARPAHHHRPKTHQLLVAAVIFSLGLATAALFRGRGRAPAAQEAPAPAPVAATLAAPKPDEPPVATVDARPAVPDAAPLRALPAAPAPAPVQRIIITSTPAALTLAPAPKPNPLITSFVARGVIGGVDAGGPDHKALVLFNDSIYHLNDIVDYALGIRLVAVQPNRITFEDSRGVLYVRDLFPM
ncbi:MAG TPA: hypothetical protein VFE31_09630 [Opitutaceae bacterium]|jgi:hypothetical protein|nr:hypothetical protein [Opitutaceae bacterium]